MSTSPAGPVDGDGDPRQLALEDGPGRDLALRAAGLSDAALKTIQDMITRARVLEGLPDLAVATRTGSFAAGIATVYYHSRRSRR